ncbi:Beta-secretase 2 [Rhizoclosmatium sp. JEL0117]|nr:Beta-secretase 2 [Rhizoclosmatium sp. JEL0117]
MAKPENLRPTLNASSTVINNAASGAGYEQSLSGGPLITGCYNINIFVSGVKFNVQLDSGSSDLLIPGSTIQAYTGPTYSTSSKTPLTQQTIGSSFADGSSWTGRFYYDQVGIDDGSIIVSAPFAVMQQQTSNPTVTDGSTSQGLLGIAYDTLSTVNYLNLPAASKQIPKTVLSALSNNKSIANDMIAMRSCPGNSQTQSVVDWGASNSSLTCTPEASISWAAVISASYYTVNVTSIKIGDTQMDLDHSKWQQNGAVSIFDSCTTVMLLPDNIYNIFVTTLTNSGGFGSTSAKNIDLFLNQGYGFSDFAADFTKFPDLTFQILGEDGASLVEISIPAQGYIQQDSNGYSFFTVGSQTELGVVFGGTVFDNFYVVLDRGGQRVGLGLGCDCEM